VYTAAAVFKMFVQEFDVDSRVSSVFQRQINSNKGINELKRRETLFL